MKVSADERDIVLRLLQENATLGEVCQFLKRKGLHFSATSWDQFFEKRLLASLAERKLTRDDLIEMLRLSEEYGKQHVFLHRCSAKRAHFLMERSRLVPALKEIGLENLLRSPRLLDQPTSPTVADVRWESDGQALIVKVVEQRVYRRFVDEKTEGPFLIRRYREFKVRAVNLFRLRQDGLLELRIYSHVNASDYRNDVLKMWSLAESLFPRKEFTELALTKAKNNLWRKRNELKGILRYSDSSLRNPFGTVLSAATGSEQMSLFDDEGATRSLDEFLRHDAFCDTSNVWWLKGKVDNKKPNKDVVPSKDVHMLLSGASNEFVVTAKCLKEDYEYVLRQLETHNR